MKTFNYLILSGILMTSTVQAADCPTAPNVGVSITTPTSDFILQGPVAIHKKTGLMWQRCMVGEVFSDNNTLDTNDDSCTGNPIEAGMAEAYTLSQQAVANYTDWRLPNIKELYSIEEECPSLDGHLINLTVFPVSSANRSADKIPVLWSSTNLVMTKQIINPKSTLVALRLVREVKPIATPTAN
ncbi:MAG: DUF1566 domain-containing protein [Thiofilum sp.]|uniref:Lcl C-terminal domain-containing protein n=1 Tax=Thiofilum sp. TaxID=2212733 RepID=UPI0025E1E2D4|nr:DUF1566 domain-containing protein [Thiofilum sp.]MBK8454390.1 DUF1566 domain-containing protein [Thiofilum sp.]